MITQGGAEASVRARAAAGVGGWRRRHLFRPARLAAADAGARAGALEPARDRARSRVGLLAFAGIELLVISELVDRLEHLEGDLGIGWGNLILAALFATPIVWAAALVGDAIVGAAARRSGRRPGGRLAAPLAALAGGAVGIGILASHLRHSPALDGWVGLAGSLLFLLAAVSHYHRFRAGNRTPLNSMGRTHPSTSPPQGLAATRQVHDGRAAGSRGR